MPGATPILGLPYPYADEEISDASFANLANAVDAILNTYHNTRRVAALHRPTAGVYSTSIVQAATVATATNLNFDTTQWDSTGTMAGTTGITIPADGIYVASGSCSNDGSFTTFTSTRSTITLAGTSVAHHKIKGTTFGTIANVVAVFQATAGQLVRLQTLWTGSGTLNIRFSTLDCSQIFAL
jgi:hypothetical protein